MVPTQFLSGVEAKPVYMIHREMDLDGYLSALSNPLIPLQITLIITQYIPGRRILPENSFSLPFRN